MTEPLEVTRKRLYMRSIRRGIKEMDLILSDFAGRHLDGMTQVELELYDALLSENDHDLYAWISGQAQAPARYVDLVDRVAQGARGVARP